MRPPFDALDKGAKRIARGPDGSELVPADMTYYEWLKTQPASFQNDAIGPRRAELLRNGGLSAKRFSELNLGRNFQPLTLEEMKRVEPGAFERAANVKNNLLSGEERSILDKGGGVDKNRIFNMADTDGRRNEKPLTPEQKQAVVDYAVSLGMNAERITFSETAITGYIGGDFDISRIGTDVLPLDKKSANPNDNISLKGVIAHEIVGHRGADLKGRSFQKYEDLHLDEAQASIIAARFAPGLSDKDRMVLLRDGVMRLKNAGKTLREVRSLLHINER